MKASANIGLFTEPFTFQESVRVKDSYGQMKETFADKYYGFCQLSKLSGEEAVRSMQIDVPEYYELTCHYLPFVDTKYRVVIDSVNYNILRIDYLDRKTFMKLKIALIPE